MIFFPEYVRTQRESYERQLARERAENAKLRSEVERLADMVGVLKWELAEAERKR